MHRVSLPAAIGILALLIIVAVSRPEYVDQTAIWIVIAVNFIFVVIGLVRAAANRTPADTTVETRPSVYKQYSGKQNPNRRQ